MPIVLADLQANIGADDSGLQTTLKAAQASVEQFTATTNQALAASSASLDADLALVRNGIANYSAAIVSNRAEMAQMRSALADLTIAEGAQSGAVAQLRVDYAALSTQTGELVAQKALLSAQAQELTAAIAAEASEAAAAAASIEALGIATTDAAAKTTAAGAASAAAISPIAALRAEGLAAGGEFGRLGRAAALLVPGMGTMGAAMLGVGIAAAFIIPKLISLFDSSDKLIKVNEQVMQSHLEVAATAAGLGDSYQKLSQQSNALTAAIAGARDPLTSMILLANDAFTAVGSFAAATRTQADAVGHLSSIFLENNTAAVLLAGGYDGLAHKQAQANAAIQEAGGHVQNATRLLLEYYLNTDISAQKLVQLAIQAGATGPQMIELTNILASQSKQALQLAAALDQVRIAQLNMAATGPGLTALQDQLRTKTMQGVTAQLSMHDIVASQIPVWKQMETAIKDNVAATTDHLTKSQMHEEVTRRLNEAIQAGTSIQGIADSGLKNGAQILDQYNKNLETYNQKAKTGATNTAGLQRAFAGVEPALTFLLTRVAAGVPIIDDLTSHQGKLTAELKKTEAAVRTALPAVNEYLQSIGAGSVKSFAELSAAGADLEGVILKNTIAFEAQKSAVIQAGLAIAGQAGNLKQINDYLKAMGDETALSVEQFSAMKSQMPGLAEALQKHAKSAADAAKATADLDASTAALHVTQDAASIAWARVAAAMQAAMPQVNELDAGLQNLAVTTPAAANAQIYLSQGLNLNVLQAARLGAAITQLSAALQSGNVLEVADQLKQLHAVFVEVGTAAGLGAQVIEQKWNAAMAAMKTSTTDGMKTVVDLVTKGLKQVADPFDQLRKKIGDTFTQMLEGITEALGANAAAVARWAGDIGGILDSMPGKFGDTGRKIEREVNQWIKFIGAILQTISDMGVKLPGILDDIFGVTDKAVQQTTQTVSSAAASISDVWSTGMADVVDSTQQAGTAIHEAMHTTMSGVNAEVEQGAQQVLTKVAGMMAGIAMIISGHSQGGVSGAVQGALGGLMTGAEIGSFFGPIGTGIGAAIGAIGGLFAGLFGGGMSAQQKQQQELQLKQMEADLQKTAVDTANTAITAMKNALEMFNQLADFTRVPQTAINRFFNQLNEVIQDFFNMASQFNKSAVDAAKTFADGIGSVLSDISSGVQAFKALEGFLGVPSGAVEAFAAEIRHTIDVFMGVTDDLLADGVKHAVKIMNLASGIMDDIKSGVDAFTALQDLGDIPQQQFDRFKAAIEAAISMMAVVADDIGVYAVKKAAQFAGHATDVVNSIAAGVAAFVSLQDLKDVPAAAFTAFKQGLVSAINALSDAAAAVSDDALLAADRLATNSQGVVGLIKNAIDALSSIGSFVGVNQAAADTLAQGIRIAVQAIDDVANQMDITGVKAGSRFSVAAKDTVDLLKGAIDGLTALQTYSGVAPETINRFAEDVELTVTAMNNVAAKMDIDATTAAGKFSAAARDVLSTIKDSVAGILSLQNYTSLMPFVIDEFAADVQKVVAGFVQISTQISGQAVTDASLFADKSNVIFTAIKTAVDAFNAIRQYSTIPETAFQLMSADIDRVFLWMQLMLIKLQASLDLATQFQTIAQKLADTLKSAFSTLGSLGSLTTGLSLPGTSGGAPSLALTGAAGASAGAAGGVMIQSATFQFAAPSNPSDMDRAMQVVNQWAGMQAAGKAQ